MISGDRTYQYMGKLLLKRSQVLKAESQPKDDILQWLFLIKAGKHQFTFFYKIEKPKEATYEMPFNVQMSFIMDEIKDYIQINHVYEVWRAEEPIGTVEIIGALE